MVWLETPASAAFATSTRSSLSRRNRERVQLTGEIAPEYHPSRFEALLAVGAEVRPHPDEFDHPANRPRQLSPDREPRPFAA